MAERDLNASSSFFYFILLSVFGVSNAEPQRLGGSRTHLGVPILREGTPIGVILLSRRTVRPFDNKQVELATSCTDQAVIALVERHSQFCVPRLHLLDLPRVLDEQTATSEFLKVIGRSVFDVQPVFETLVENALRLCEAKRAFILRFDGPFLRFAVAITSRPAHLQ